MVSERRRKRLILAGAALVGICIPAVVDLSFLFPSLSSVGIGSIIPDSEGGRRSLNIKDYRKLVGKPTEDLPWWAREQVVASFKTPRPDKETALFWHVPKSGGTTIKSLYECMGKTLANRVGGQKEFGHDKDRKIIVFEPFEASVLTTVNVDVTSKEGILRAETMGLAASGKSDLIVTSELSFAGEHLFDEKHKGRIMAMFRHPVDRAVSKFYYLQTATWERTYRPEWQNMPIEEWAAMTKGNNDQNFLVTKLNNKTFKDPVNETDLEVSKQLLKHSFIVGLMTDMEESVRRFNVVLGLDESREDKVRGCMQDTFAPKEEGTKAKNKQNSNKHPKVEEDSQAYQILAQRNNLDMQLYEYAVQLFADQRQIIDEFVDRTKMKEERKIERKEDRKGRTAQRRTERFDKIKEDRKGEREAEKEMVEKNPELRPKKSRGEGFWA